MFDIPIVQFKGFFFRTSHGYSSSWFLIHSLFVLHIANTAWKVSELEVFPRPNSPTYESRKTPNLDTLRVRSVIYSNKMKPWFHYYSHCIRWNIIHNAFSNILYSILILCFYIKMKNENSLRFAFWDNPCNCKIHLSINNKINNTYFHYK